MNKAMKLALAAVLLTAPTISRSVCNTFGTGLNLPRPQIGDRFDVWAQCSLDFMSAINDGAASSSTVFAIATDVAASTSALSASTETLRIRVDALDASTATIFSRLGEVAVSTTANRALVDALGVSTASNRAAIDALGVSTFTNRTAIDALGVSTASLASSKLDKTSTDPLSMLGSAATITTQSSVTASGIFTNSVITYSVRSSSSDSTFNSAALSMKSGDGALNTDGGPITLVSGSGAAPGGDGSGGNISLTAGQGGTPDVGRLAGEILLTGGLGKTGAGGASATTKGGNVRISGGNAASTSGNSIGGDVLIAGGEPLGVISPFGGKVYIRGGSGGAGTSGDVIIGAGKDSGKVVFSTGSVAIATDTFVGSEKLRVLGEVVASTFNAVGSAFQVNGITFIDSDLRFYGDGTAITGVALSTEVDALSGDVASLSVSTEANASAIFSLGVSTDALRFDLTSETNARVAADDAIGASTAALESSKVNRAGDTMTGHLRVESSSAVVSADAATTIYVESFGGANAPFFLGSAAGGTSGSPSQVLSGALTGCFGGRGLLNNLTQPFSRSRMCAFAGENQTTSSQGHGIRFDTVNNGSTSRSTRMLINPNGSVGLGYNQGATLPFQFQMTGAAGIGNPSSADGTLVVKSTSSTNGHAVIMAQDNSGTELMRMTRQGRLGIGTSTPGAKLHVGNASSGGVNVSGTSAGYVIDGTGTNGIVLAKSSSNGVWLSNDESGDLVLRNRSNPGRVVIAADDSGVGSAIFSSSLADFATGAQFGSGVLKSTFNATPGDSVYALQLSSGLVTATGGLNSAFVSASLVSADAAFSVGVSTLVATGGKVGVGTAFPEATLDVAGGIGFQPQTIAQLQAIAPARVGVAYYCSDCAPAKLVISTGTSAGNFADTVGGEFK